MGMWYKSLLEEKGGFRKTNTFSDTFTSASKQDCNTTWTTSDHYARKETVYFRNNALRYFCPPNTYCLFYSFVSGFCSPQ